MHLVPYNCDSCVTWSHASQWSCFMKHSTNNTTGLTWNLLIRLRQISDKTKLHKFSLLPKLFCCYLIIFPSEAGVCLRSAVIWLIHQKGNQGTTPLRFFFILFKTAGFMFLFISFLTDFAFVLISLGSDGMWLTFLFFEHERPLTVLFSALPQILQEEG